MQAMRWFDGHAARGSARLRWTCTAFWGHGEDWRILGHIMALAVLVLVVLVSWEDIVLGRAVNPSLWVRQASCI